ncbi:MAG: signal peptidase I [Clostridiales Family XIII bacterium]|jgi:signal peptidase I|nr:signal peptidase I [Clostridiales Family XIII bacterium]
MEKTIEEINREFSKRYDSLGTSERKEEQLELTRGGSAEFERAAAELSRVARKLDGSAQRLERAAQALEDAARSADRFFCEPRGSETFACPVVRAIDTVASSQENGASDQRSDACADRVCEASRVRPTRRAARILCNGLLIAFCVALVASSAVFAFSKDPKKSVFGYRFYNVLTNSMTPKADSPPGGFLAGDLVIVKMCDPRLIETGDIITFAADENGNAFLTHRVAEIKTEAEGKKGLWFVTRGDANNADDPPVPSDRVVGKKVLTVPKLGFAIQQTRENPIPVAIFIVSAFGFIIALRYCFSIPKAKTAFDRKNRKTSI